MYRMVLEDDFCEFIRYIIGTQLVDVEADIPRVPRRAVKDRENPLELYSDGEFIARYRFTKETVAQVLLPWMGPANVTERGLPLPPILKLLTCLRFYATGSFQVVCGDLTNISQSTVSRIIKLISRDIAAKLPDWVRFPSTNQEYVDYSEKFYAIKQLPCVVGCIDCTHVPIISPGGGADEVYRNRKGWPSLNVQVLFGPDMEITDIDARWPGSIHDAKIFQNSKLKLSLDKDSSRGIILGDRGYPQFPYLYTPVGNPATQAEKRYNTAHFKTSSVVASGFEVWKRRFHCLSLKLRTKLTTTIRIILACAVLHNIAIKHEDELPNTIPMVPRVTVPVLAVHSQNQRGVEERHAFIQQHFGQVV